MTYLTEERRLIRESAREFAMREVLPVAVSSRPRRLVYVSCHPGSFARDAGILVKELGYRLAAAGIMDMFPHTSHVESIALFEPRR